jgi:hypothetical protein
MANPVTVNDMLDGHVALWTACFQSSHLAGSLLMKHADRSRRRSDPQPHPHARSKVRL